MTDFEVTRENLSRSLRAKLSKKRFEHTIGVCRMAERLAEYCLPDDRDEICLAALLHDVAKELTAEEQLKIIYDKNISLLPADSASVYHSYVAPHVVKNEFPEIATPKILSAIEKHTVGDADMSIFDEIIFLADYIEEGRTYPDCVKTREFVLSSLVDGDVVNNINVLHRGCIMSIDLTCKSLLERGKIVNPRSFEAKKALEAKIF